MCCPCEPLHRSKNAQHCRPTAPRQPETHRLRHPDQSRATPSQPRFTHRIGNRLPDRTRNSLWFRGNIYGGRNALIKARSNAHCALGVSGGKHKARIVFIPALLRPRPPNGTNAQPRSTTRTVAKPISPAPIPGRLGGAPSLRQRMPRTWIRNGIMRVASLFRRHGFIAQPLGGCPCRPLPNSCGPSFRGSGSFSSTQTASL